MTAISSYHQQRAREFNQRDVLRTAHARMDRAHGSRRESPANCEFGSYRHTLLFSARWFYREALGLDGWERVS